LFVYLLFPLMLT